MQHGTPDPSEESDGDDLLGSWLDRAACRGTDPAIFFPERGDSRGVEFAKSICAACDVRVECLEENLFEDDGIFGGLSGRQRRQMRSKLGQRRTCRHCASAFLRTHPGQAYCSEVCKRAPRDVPKRYGL